MSPARYFGGGGTTFVEPVDGPQLHDGFGLRLGFPETSTTPGDNLGVAYTFPETAGASSDNLNLRFGFPEDNATPGDAVATLGVATAQSNPVPDDAATYHVAFAAADTTPAPVDATALRIAGAGDTNAVPTDARSGSITWTRAINVNNVTTGWTNPANALNFKDGVSATFSDTSTATTAGELASSLNDSDATLATWTITSVRLLFFLSGTFSALSGARLHIEYRLTTGGVWTTLESTATTFNDLAAGRDFDITAAIAGSWANVNAVEVRLRYTTSLITETATLTYDACHLEVLANKTSF